MKTDKVAKRRGIFENIFVTAHGHSLAQMMRARISALAIISICASASPSNPGNGVKYQTLPNAQPTTAGKKVEVIEFFGYFCSHCHALDRPLSEWVKKQGNKIAFKRIPVSPREARIYFALESMGQLEKIRDKVFHAVQVERQRLGSERAAADFVARLGIDREQFLQHYNFAVVQEKVNSLANMSAGYKVESVPLLVVDGRYVTSPSIVSRCPCVGDSETA
ncbi:MAG: thiol:disulfide interchange protein DsbA/DsbL [Burkholderiaceae bacterium]|nr:thiol:disulfide interchange protein DsbA/DsbL [Burkholderiaceae bacterium]